LWRAPPSRPTTSWVHRTLRFLHLEHTLSCTTVITWHHVEWLTHCPSECSRNAAGNRIFGFGTISKRIINRLSPHTREKQTVARFAKKFRLLWKPKIQCRVYKIQQLVPIVN
jgi:hypothetical protein